MRNKSNIDFENIKRMSEIAEVYEITGQSEKSEKYHKSIVKICDSYPKSEKMLTCKINSLNYLKKTYKSLETTNELLNLNPNNLAALFNLAEHIIGD
ncbi:hypothetical protein [Methanobrevibacter sp.]|uniref:hypothetical protein n=1 Tax=Methanobrevibacter sp. TaxID=66852 RepID=UPI00386B3CD8